LERLRRDVPDEDGEQWEDEDILTYQDILDGAVPITISHAGGEMADMQRGL
jgi:hypothetical protein